MRRRPRHAAPRPCAWNIALRVALLVCVAGDAAAQSRLVRSGPDVEAMRAEMSIGGFADRVVGLSPCEPEARIAHASDRPGAAMWAGRFRVLRAGTGGDWHLVVKSADGVERWRRQIVAAHAPGAAAWETPVVVSSTIRLELVGPGVPGSLCPRVRLEGELLERPPTQPRGAVGNDDRLPEASPGLAALPDAAGIRRWAAGVVHMRVISKSGKLLPCTGFFISAHALVTASHCVKSDEEAFKSVVFLGDRQFTGADITLLIAQPDLDYTILWIAAAEAPVSLPPRDNPDRTLILWQQPGDPKPERLVSVEQCTVHAIEGRRIAHKCDTSIGTSGAPIQTRAAGDVVAVHVAGCTSSNGKPSCVNHGLRMTEIRASVAELAAELRQVFPAEAPQVLAAFGIGTP